MPAANRPSIGRSARSPWNRKNPYPAVLLENVQLSSEHSEKEVRHFTFDLADSGLTYEPGDGLNVRPVNDDRLVDALIERLGVDPDTPLTARDGSVMSLRDTLLHQREIGTPSQELLEAAVERSHIPELVEALAHHDTSRLTEWSWGKDVLDILEMVPDAQFTAEEFVKLLDPLQHRTYSISSSPLAHGTQIHATVASVRYDAGGRGRGGVCSTYLADRAGATAAVFISKNSAFRLPADDTVPIIMIGPGTGVAPFRAFLHERAARGATGANWLFFGDQRRDHDFIYSDELAGFVDSGLLTRLDLAFSRDQEHKVYVQDKLREQGADVYQWLVDGAYLYVCGDAQQMASDVDDAIREIVREHGRMSNEEAAEWISALRKSKRYMRDVY